MAIKNIIFDFGNVIVNLDYKKVETAYIELYGEEDYKIANKTFQETNLLFDYERGEISEEFFFQSFLDIINRTDISVPKMRDAWNSILGKIPKERIQLLKDLKNQGYQLYMLSNINHSHATRLHEYINDEFGINEQSWREHFVQIFYSHEIGHRKPDTSSFQYVLDTAGIKAEESLFIDDLKENTDVAASLGIHTITHDPKSKVVEVLTNYLQS